MVAEELDLHSETIRTQVQCCNLEATRAFDRFLIN